jgi:hypothetical protein
MQSRLDQYPGDILKYQEIQYEIKLATGEKFKPAPRQLEKRDFKFLLESLRINTK